MIFEKTTVISNEMVTSNSYVIWLEASNLTKRGYYPGQFAMLKCNDANESESFSRAFSFHQRDGNRIAFLYTIVGKGTAWLSLRKQDDQIEVYGPLGEGFRIPRDTGRLLLLGGGIGIAPMPEMATFSISKGHQVTVIMGANTKNYLDPSVSTSLFKIIYTLDFLLRNEYKYLCLNSSFIIRISVIGITTFLNTGQFSMK